MTKWLLLFRSFGNFFGHLVFYLFGNLDSVYDTSSFENRQTKTGSKNQNAWAEIRQAIAL